MSDETKKDKDILRHHQFDGIQEYENQLPKWWIGMFYLSIVFAAGYFYYYVIDESGPSLRQEYEKTQAEEVAKQALAAQNQPQMTEEQLLALAQKPEVVKAGEEQFRTKCMSCHAPDGGGLVGPNFTDDYWIHGNKMTDMIKVIREGVAAKGMPNWGAMMSMDEIYAAAAYIRTLHGTKPANPKAPEGTLFK